MYELFTTGNLSLANTQHDTGAAELGLDGELDAVVFRSVLEGTAQKSFYVEISRARDRAELVTGEHIAALEGVGEMARDGPDRSAGDVRSGRRRSGRDAAGQRDGAASPSKDRDMPAPDRGRDRSMDLGL